MKVSNIAVSDKEIPQNTGEVRLSALSNVYTGEKLGTVDGRRVDRHRVARRNFCTVYDKPSLVIVSVHDENSPVRNVVPNRSSRRIGIIKVGRERVLESVSNKTNLDYFVALTVSVLAEIHYTTADTVVASWKESVRHRTESANVGASPTELNNGRCRSVEGGGVVVRTKRRKGRKRRGRRGRRRRRGWR